MPLRSQETLLGFEGGQVPRKPHSCWGRGPPALESLKDPRGRQCVHEVAEHVGRRPLQTRFTVAPIKSLPRKTTQGPGVQRVCGKPGGSPHYFDHPPHNAAGTQGPSQRCSQTQAGSRSVPGVSAHGSGDLGFNRQELPQDPRA